MPYMELTEANRSFHIGRVNALKPDAPARWGRLSAVQMVAHLRKSIEVSLGEVPVRDRGTLLTRTVLRWYLMGFRDWPRAKLQAPPELLAADTQDFEEEIRRLKDAIGRFVAARMNAPDTILVHPRFGPMTIEAFARLHGKHMDHHFTQFGV
jgi:hypothetical protein